MIRRIMFPENPAMAEVEVEESVAAESAIDNEGDSAVDDVETDIGEGEAVKPGDG